jgi:hypothetical protein
LLAQDDMAHGNSVLVWKLPHRTPTTKPCSRPPADQEVTRKTGPPTFLEPAEQARTTVSRPPRKDTSSVTKVERPVVRPSKEQQTQSASGADIVAEVFEEDVVTDPFGPRRPVLTPAGQRAETAEPEDRHGIPKRLTTSWETTQKVRLPPRRPPEEGSVTSYLAQAPAPHFLLRHLGLVLIFAMLFAAGVGLAMLAASDPLH